MDDVKPDTAAPSDRTPDTHRDPMVVIDGVNKHFGELQELTFFKASEKLDKTVTSRIAAPGGGMRTSTTSIPTSKTTDVMSGKKPFIVRLWLAYVSEVSR